MTAVLIYYLALPSNTTISVTKRDPCATTARVETLSVVAIRDSLIEYTGIRATASGARPKDSRSATMAHATVKRF